MSLLKRFDIGRGERNIGRQIETLETQNQSIECVLLVAPRVATGQQLNRLGSNPVDRVDLVENFVPIALCHARHSVRPATVSR